MLSFPPETDWGVEMPTAQPVLPRHWMHGAMLGGSAPQRLGAELPLVLVTGVEFE